MTSKLALALGFVVPTGLACDHVVRPDSLDIAALKRRAAFDLQCPEEDLKILRIDRRTRGVKGCGLRGAYVLNCQHDVYEYDDQGQGIECTWVMDAKQAPGRSAPQPQPSTPTPRPSPSAAGPGGSP